MGKQLLITALVYLFGMAGLDAIFCKKKKGDQCPCDPKDETNKSGSVPLEIMCSDGVPYYIEYDPKTGKTQTITKEEYDRLKKDAK